MKFFKNSVEPNDFFESKIENEIVFANTAFCSDNIKLKLNEDTIYEQEKDNTDLKDFFKVRIGKIGHYLRSNHIILTKRNKLNKIANSINQGLMLTKRPISKSKQVMFIDQFGMELELIHTIQVNRSPTYLCEENLENQIRTKPIINYKTINQEPMKDLQPKLIPKFKLFSNEMKLQKNGISLNSIEVYNDFSIRGIIQTSNNIPSLAARKKVSLKNNSSIENNCFDEEPKTKSSFFKSFKNGLLMSKKTQKPNPKLDLVYIIWSIDEWKTWKSQVAIQKACITGKEENVLKMHEFFLQNIDKVLISGQTLQIVVCHQVDDMIFYDTNNENCYSYELNT